MITCYFIILIFYISEYTYLTIIKKNVRTEVMLYFFINTPTNAGHGFSNAGWYFITYFDFKMLFTIWYYQLGIYQKT